MIDGTIPARTAAVIRTAALRVGVPTAHLHTIAGLAPAALDDALLRVPTESVWRIWELIDDLAGPGSGLCAADAAEHGDLRAWDYLFSCRATLAESLRTVIELRAVATDPTGDWELVEDGRLLTIRAMPIEPDRVLAPVEEFVLAGLLRRIRAATRQRIVPVRVAFTHRATRRSSVLYDEFDTTRIYFGAPRSEITFLDAGALPTGTDPHLGAVVLHYAELVLASGRPAPSWRDKLRAAMAEGAARGELDLDTLACRLAISSRTLQRRLREQGTTWRAEVDDMRHQQALDLLRDTELPVRSVAARLGYTDARALRRAFHRWTGQTPDAYRREATGNLPVDLVDQPT